MRANYGSSSRLTSAANPESGTTSYLYYGSHGSWGGMGDSFLSLNFRSPRSAPGVVSASPVFHRIDESLIGQGKNSASRSPRTLPLGGESAGALAQALRARKLSPFESLSSHVHLVVVPKRSTSLARAVGQAHRRYTAAFNRKYGRSGHLWQNRFYSCPLGPDHLVAALAYVDLNPVRAGLVGAARQYPWSSAGAHAAAGAGDPLLDEWRWSELGLAGNWEERLRIGVMGVMGDSFLSLKFRSSRSAPGVVSASPVFHRIDEVLIDQGKTSASRLPRTLPLDGESAGTRTYALRASVVLQKWRMETNPKCACWRIAAGESAGSPEGGILLAPGVSPGIFGPPNRRPERWFVEPGVKLEEGALGFVNPGLTPGASRMPPPAGA